MATKTVPKLDEAGNPVLDADGNPIMDTIEDNTPTPSDDDMVAKLVADRVAVELKDIKDKLDKAFGQRDAANAKVAAMELKEKADALAKLKEEGKHKEAYDLEIAEERTKREALEKRNVELTRDIDVKDALKSYAFRNGNAADIAFKEIAGQLVQNEQGNWVHRSGVLISDFVKGFADNEENSFLFKQKVNSGGGSGSPKGTPSGDKPTSLFATPLADVLKMAAEGKLPNQRS